MLELIARRPREERRVCGGATTVSVMASALAFHAWRGGPVFRPKTVLPQERCGSWTRCNTAWKLDVTEPSSERLSPIWPAESPRFRLGRSGCEPGDRRSKAVSPISQAGTEIVPSSSAQARCGSAIRVAHSGGPKLGTIGDTSQASRKGRGVVLSALGSSPREWIPSLR